MSMRGAGGAGGDAEDDSQVQKEVANEAARGDNRQGERGGSSFEGNRGLGEGWDRWRGTNRESRRGDTQPGLTGGELAGGCAEASSRSTGRGGGTPGATCGIRPWPCARHRCATQGGGSKSSRSQPLPAAAGSVGARRAHRGRAGVSTAAHGRPGPSEGGWGWGWVGVGVGGEQVVGEGVVPREPPPAPGFQNGRRRGAGTSVPAARWCPTWRVQPKLVGVGGWADRATAGVMQVARRGLRRRQSARRGGQSARGKLPKWVLEPHRRAGCTVTPPTSTPDDTPDVNA